MTGLLGTLWQHKTVLGGNLTLYRVAELQHHTPLSPLIDDDEPEDPQSFEQVFELLISLIQSRNRSVKSGIVRPGKPMISKEYGGVKRTIWSFFGRQFGEEFGEVLLLRRNSGRTAFSSPDPTASGNLVVDRTVYQS